MSTRKKRLKKAVKYASLSSAAATSLMEVIGGFVSVPTLIKWVTIAIAGVLGGCYGCCCAPMNEPNENEAELKPIEAAIHQDLAEIKKELEYHHKILASASETKDAEKIAAVRSQVVERWKMLAKVHEEKKSEEKTPLQTTGLFVSSVPLPRVPSEIKLENEANLKLKLA